jgi:hypothetical protein
MSLSGVVALPIPIPSFASGQQKAWMVTRMEEAVQVLKDSQRFTVDSSHNIGYIETLLTIVQYGLQRGEVRTDIAPEHLACYIGVLYISLIHRMTDQFSSAQYTSEVETLLTFLRTALHS